MWRLLHAWSSGCGCSQSQALCPSSLRALRHGRRRPGASGRKRHQTTFGEKTRQKRDKNLNPFRSMACSSTWKEISPMSSSMIILVCEAPTEWCMQQACKTMRCGWRWSKRRGALTHLTRLASVVASCNICNTCWYVLCRRFEDWSFEHI